MTAPTMDERRAVARRMREYKCPVLPSHQTTREAVDAAIECMGLGDGEEICTVRQFLDRLAELIDPGEDVSVSAYDLLTEEDREALRWVRGHGGLDSVKKLLDWVVGHCSTRQQLDFDFWLSGRVMHELGFEEDMADRDEVERRLLARLMPDGMEWLVEAWPRFEDNEPVRFLDDFERYGDENGVSVVTMYQDGSFALNCRAYSKGERVNRPAPKVLDADGVEIRVGDEVWVVGDAWPSMKVLEIQPDDDPDVPEHLVWCGEMCGEPLNDTKKWRIANQLTHRAPVLAADGKPIRVGDTVWYANGDGLQLTVVRIESDRVVTTSARDGEQWWAAYILTHEQPDSWERLEDDTTQHPWYYCKQHGVDTDAASPDADLAEVVTPFARDLVRRARALAERGQ